MIEKLSFRDHRKYSEVLTGKQLTPKDDEVTNAIPICFTLKAAENKDVGKMLDHAIIAENTEVINLAQSEIEVSTMLKSVKGMFSLSPIKILIVFESKSEAAKAISVNSKLWNIFDDIRLWSEGDMFDNRLIWIECYGIHPKCWSKENVRRIGEKWGPVLSIDNRIDGICSLTYARMLVRTKAQNKVDVRIQILCDHGSCDVWVKERSWCSEKHSKLASDSHVNLDTVLGSVPNRKAYVSANANVNSNTPLVQSHCSSFSDPLISDLLSKSERLNDCLWLDPIVVNETARWIMINSDDRSMSYPNPGEEQVQLCDNTTSVCSQRKNPRGRPKKTRNQQQNVSDTPAPSKSCLEALDTWNTAKLLGITSTEEDVVISGLRKSDYGW